jgi:hypothetical protein
MICVECVSQTESIGKESRGCERRLGTEDYCDDSPDYEVYEDEEGNYGDGGEGEESELRWESGS